MRLITPIALALALSGTPLLAKAPAPAPSIAAAVAASDRAPDNAKLDESRKPAEVLSFFGLRPGMHVLDIFGANGYWTEIVAPAVGPKGSVVAWQGTQFLNDKEKTGFAELAKRHPNASLITSSMDSPNFGQARYDLAIFNLNYHDLYVDDSKRGVATIEPRQWLKSLYAAMKPGGIVGVIDHVANPGDTRASANALHRIDPNTLEADFKSAGFVLVKTSDILRNPADDHSLKVFDPKIRGNTDRAIFKFKKPR